MSAGATRRARLDRRTLLHATATPLASIFGSGFLIIVPVLEAATGKLAVFGVALVCLAAWFVGSAIRHNIGAVEPARAAGTLGRGTARLELWSDIVIVIAYVISVTLYVRIMSSFVLEFAGADSERSEQLLTSAVVLLIGAIGVTRGFGGLQLFERTALGATLVLVVWLTVDFAAHGASRLADGTFELPPVVDSGIVETLMLLGGIVICVQGFETVRYLQHEYDAPTRLAASRLSQIVATVVYLAFVAVATPLMALSTGPVADHDLLELTRRVAPLLVIPLVLTAALSQLSAATADTVAAVGNLSALAPRRLAGRLAFAVTTAAAIAMAWTISSFAIASVASRAFAAYYCLQAIVAMRTSDTGFKRMGYGLLALVMLGVAVFAKPVG